MVQGMAQRQNAIKEQEKGINCCSKKEAQDEAAGEKPEFGPKTEFGIQPYHVIPLSRYY